LRNKIDSEECIYDEFIDSNLRHLNEQDHDGVDPDRLQVYSMQSGHFSINRVWHAGSIILFPFNCFFWEVEKPSDITRNSLRIFEVIKPRPDILLIGTGKHGIPLDQSFIEKFQNLGITLEYDDSFEICCLFNSLNEEKRNVAAAVLPTNVEERGLMEEDMLLPGAFTVQFPTDVRDTVVGKHKWRVTKLIQDRNKRDDRDLLNTNSSELQIDSKHKNKNDSTGHSLNENKTKVEYIDQPLNHNIDPKI